jgi:hypothetical protein
MPRLNCAKLMAGRKFVSPAKLKTKNSATASVIGGMITGKRKSPYVFRPNVWCLVME